MTCQRRGLWVECWPWRASGPRGPALRRAAFETIEMLTRQIVEADAELEAHEPSEEEEGDGGF